MAEPGRRTIEIASPEGPLGELPKQLAPAPELLAGLRIGVLDNRKPNARVLLEGLATLLAERTGARVSLVAVKGNAAVRCEADLLEKLRAEADVVLTGSGD
jgi:hypothetical protein